MPSTSRFRSKTSDISDLLRGGSKHSDTHLPVPLNQDGLTPTKGKRKLGFLRRKSGSVLPTPPSPSGAARNNTPGVLSGARPPIQTGPAQIAGTSSSLPSSLPPLNVSPPSLGSFSQFSSKPRSTDTPQTPDPAVLNPPPKRFQVLRAQKSTSFEFAGRGRFIQQPHVRSRPVITVSAPPQNVKDADNVFTQPRNPPNVPGIRFTRKPLSNPFSHKKEGVNEAPLPPSPLGSSSPALPPTMHFPAPPPRPDLSTSLQEVSMLQRGSFDRQNEHMVQSPTSTTFSRTSSQLERFSRDAPGTLSPINTHFLLPGDTPEISPTRPRLFTNASGPPPSTSTPRPTSWTSSKSVPATGTSPSKSIRRASRSPSPARDPPTGPLPDLPADVSQEVTKDPHIPLRNSDTLNLALNSVPTIPSLPSVSTRSIASFQQKVFRTRAQTVAASGHEALGRAERRRGELEREAHEAGVPRCIPTLRHSKHPPTPPEKDKSRSRPPSFSPGERSRVPSNSGTSSMAGDLRIHDSVVEVQTAHERYVISLREAHASEKAELLQRIERLEREARKRDREIKGLRWLVMNASGQGVPMDVAGSSTSGGPTNKTTPPSSGIPRRFRAGSRSSQLSQTSSSPGQVSEAAPLSTVYSPRGSTEEGLYELQSTVSDLIAPSTSTAPFGTFVQGSPPTEKTSRRMRRANTMPDGAPPPSIVMTSTSKQTRRTSSPVLPIPITPIPPTPSSSSSRNILAGAGLGIDISRSAPSISASDSQNSSSGDSNTLSSALTIPSLSSTSTAVSGLSAILESPLPRSHSVRVKGTQSNSDSDREKERKGKDERRASKALKRISASSTSSSIAAASSANVNNIKLGKSPSIEQVLGHSSLTDMDEVLKRLRAFGGAG